MIIENNGRKFSAHYDYYPAYPDTWDHEGSDADVIIYYLEVLFKGSWLPVDLTRLKRSEKLNKRILDEIL